MIFKKSDREKLFQLFFSIEGNKQSLHTVISEIKDLIIICRRIENLQENLWNEFELLKSRMIAIENKVTPKIAPPEKPALLKPKKK